MLFKAGGFWRGRLEETNIFSGGRGGMNLPRSSRLSQLVFLPGFL
jgi:hypothetical protein